MPGPLRRYVLEIVSGAGSFGRNARGRKVFRYREEYEYIRFRSRPERALMNARRHFLRFKARNDAYDLVDIHLYAELETNPERLIR